MPTLDLTPATVTSIDDLILETNLLANVTRDVLQTLDEDGDRPELTLIEQEWVLKMFNENAYADEIAREIQLGRDLRWQGFGSVPGRQAS